MDGVDFKETRFFQEVSRFGKAFPLEGEFFPVRLELAVYGSRAGLQQQFSDFRRYVKHRFQMFHLASYERGKDFPAPVPEENPDCPENGGEFICVDWFPAPAFSSFLRGSLEPYCFPE